MGIQERKQREKEQRRQSILQAARNLFFKKGLDKTSMADIAEAAELSKGTLYIYFKNKDELAITIAKEILDQEKQIIASCLNGKGNTLERLKILAKNYRKHFLEHSAHFKFLHHYDSLIAQGIAPISALDGCVEEVSTINELFQRILEDGIRDGSLRGDMDPKVTAEILILLQYHALSGLADTSSSEEVLFNRKIEDLIDQIFTFFIRSMQKVN